MFHASRRRSRQFTLCCDRGDDQESTAALKKTDDALVDAVVLSAATESQHYEIAVYETLVTNGDARGAAEVVALLRQNLNQKKHALDITRFALRTIGGALGPARTGGVT